MEPIYGRVEGSHGWAEPVPIPVRAEAAETLAVWLLDAPMSHPFWTQYYMYVVKLTDGLPGFPEPTHTFEGSTHELVVFALNPEQGKQTVERMAGYFEEWKMPPVLVPHNIGEQFTATDDEMIRILSLLAQAVVHGMLNPDTDGRAAWRPSIEDTFAHFRGGHGHAS